MAEAQENYKTVLGELDKMQAQIASLLPKHIPVERFTRIVRTAALGALPSSARWRSRPGRIWRNSKKEI